MNSKNVNDSKTLGTDRGKQDTNVCKFASASDSQRGAPKKGSVDEMISDDLAKLHDAKALLANLIKLWMVDSEFRSITQAAKAIGEKRETLSRVLSLKLESVTLDKLYRVAALAGLEVQVDAVAKIQIADEMAAWMSGLLKLSIEKLHDPSNRCELDSREALMKHLLDSLRGFKNKKLPRGEERKMQVRMICNDKRWDLDSCYDFYHETAKIARKRNWEIRRVLVGGDGSIVHNRSLAAISAETGVETRLLDISKGRTINFLPPKNVGFWILDKTKIIIHTSSRQDNCYVVDEVNDAALAAYLELGVFARAEEQGEPIPLAEKTQLGG